MKYFSHNLGNHRVNVNQRDFVLDIKKLDGISE
jgi:hypothetical protein